MNKPEHPNSAWNLGVYLLEHFKFMIIAVGEQTSYFRLNINNFYWPL